MPAFVNVEGHGTVFSVINVISFKITLLGRTSLGGYSSETKKKCATFSRLVDLSVFPLFPLNISYFPCMSCVEGRVASREGYSSSRKEKNARVLWNKHGFLEACLATVWENKRN